MCFNVTYIHNIPMCTNFTYTKYYFPISVHPCDKKSKGGCSQICNKRKDLHVCSCEAGFVLAKDKMTCDKGKKMYAIV